MADLKEIEDALRAADAAGNAEDARKLAKAYEDARRAQPDFGDVRGSVRTSEQFNAPAPPKRPETKGDLFRFNSDFQDRSGVGALGMLWGAAKDMFGSEQGAAEYLAKQAGGTVGQDADGSPLVVLQDGTRYRLNNPGFDNADAAKIVGNVAAAWTPAGWAARLGQARSLGLGARAAFQAGTAATTEAGLQAATDNGNVSAERVGLAAAGGAGGEVLGSGLAQLAHRGGAAIRSLTGANADEAAAVLAG